MRLFLFLSVALLVSAEREKNEKPVVKRGLRSFADSGYESFNKDISTIQQDYFGKSITLDSGFVPSLGFSADPYKDNSIKNYKAPGYNPGLIPNNLYHEANSPVPKTQNARPHKLAQHQAHALIQSTTNPPLFASHRKPVMRYTQSPILKPSRKVAFPEDKPPKLDQPIIISAIGNHEGESYTPMKTYSVSGSYTFGGSNKNNGYKKGIVNSVPLGHHYASPQKSKDNVPVSFYHFQSKPKRVMMGQKRYSTPHLRMDGFRKMPPNSGSLQEYSN